MFAKSCRPCIRQRFVERRLRIFRRADVGFLRHFSRAPVSLIGCNETPFGCSVMESTQAWSLALTPNAAAVGATRPASPLATAAWRLAAERRCRGRPATRRCPAGTRRETRSTRSRRRSAPARRSTTSRRRSGPHSTTSLEVFPLEHVDDVGDVGPRSTPTLSRCERSPRPVSVGVNTVWPWRSDGR